VSWCAVAVSRAPFELMQLQHLRVTSKSLPCGLVIGKSLVDTRIGLSNAGNGSDVQSLLYPTLNADCHSKSRYQWYLTRLGTRTHFDTIRNPRGPVQIEAQSMKADHVRDEFGATFRLKSATKS
jgi:hypothetical protein